MGQAFASGNNGKEKMDREVGSIIARCYDSYLSEDKEKEYSSAEFYKAICGTVEEINKKLGSTQFRVPEATSLKLIYEKHQKEREDRLTKEEFQEMLQEVIIETGFPGIGAKDILFYIFGVPISALLCKQRIAPKAIPNDLFIPVVTSATVFFLAKFNKI